MSPNYFNILAALLMLAAGGTVQAASTNVPPKGPADSTKVLIRMTVLGISEGVIYGSTLNNAGESIGFVSDTVGTNDIIYSMVNQNSVKPSLFATNGDFQAATNFPLIPRVHSRFTEITGYSQGIVVGNYAPASGTRAFLIGTNGALSLYSYPSAKPATTVITGISQGTVVGNFIDHRNVVHGFSYNTTNQSIMAIDAPTGIGRTHVHGISEGVIYGSFVTTNGITKGFTYSKATYTTIAVQGAAKFTELTGYSQGSVAGNFLDTNRVHHAFYFDGTNTSLGDVGTMGYSRIAGYNQAMTAGNFLETNGVMYYSTSTNVVNNRSIFLTTNYWQTTLAAYPPHITTKPPTKFVPPASQGGNRGTIGGTTSFGASNSYSGSTTLNGSSGVTLTGLNATWSNSENLQWSLGGSGTLTISGSGSTVLSGSNGYSGGTNGGTNTTTNSGELGGGSVILGAGSLTIIGTGTATLGGSNTYTGGFTISGGTVSIGTNTLPTNAWNINGEGATLIFSSYSHFPTPRINGLVFTPDTNTGSLTISNASSNDYTLGNFGSSNSLLIPPGGSDTISFADYTGTNPDIALTITPAGTTNTNGGAFLILPDTNKIEIFIP